MRVLVTGGEFGGVLAALRGLRAAGYDAWAAASTPDSYAAHTRAATRTLVLPDARRDAPRFVQSLLEAAGTNRIDAVLPGTERDLIALAHAGAQRRPALVVGAPPAEIVTRAMDKATLAERARDAGLDAPPTLELSRAALPEEPLPFPIVVKPLRSELPSADGLVHSAPVRAKTRADLAALVHGLPGDRFLVQPYLPGPIYGICGVAWHGEVLCSVHQRGLRTWPTDCGMVSYVETLSRDPELDGAAARFVGAIGWTGIYQLQFLERGDDRLLIDFNPRIYISLGLAVAAGANLPAVWADLLLGRTPQIGDYRVGVRWRSEEDDPRALLSAFRSGARRLALAGALPRRRTVHAVFALRDPRPSFVSVKKALRRARAVRQTGEQGASS